MIIFDLDGTLACCEHRRHYVQHFGYSCDGSNRKVDHCGEPFKPNWPAFYAACDQDKPIDPTIEFFESLVFENYIRLAKEVQIWSGRCESVREKTADWLHNTLWGSPSVPLKMRPIGNNTPDHVLKERWLDEAIVQGKNIDFAIDSDERSVRMWRRRGIFVFDVNQTGKEF